MEIGHYFGVRSSVLWRTGFPRLGEREGWREIWDSEGKYGNSGHIYDV